MISNGRLILIYLIAAMVGCGSVIGILYFLTGLIPHPLEIIGVTANVWGMLLIRKQNIFGWVACVIAMISIGIFSIQMQIYGQAFLQLGYFLPSVIYALYVWRKQSIHNTPALWLNNQQRLLAIVFLLILAALSSFLIQGKHGPVLHLMDTIGISFIMTGNLLMVLKKKDCWPFFFPGNILIIILFAITGGYMVAVLNIFFLLNGLKAFWEWTADDRLKA